MHMMKNKKNIEHNCENTNKVGQEVIDGDHSSTDDIKDKKKYSNESTKFRFKR